MAWVYGFLRTITKKRPSNTLLLQTEKKNTGEKADIHSPVEKLARGRGGNRTALDRLLASVVATKLSPVLPLLSQ
jgi:hypothetical protein